MKCPRCGAQVPDENARYCGACGELIAKHAAWDATAQPKRKRTGPLVACVLVAVLAVAGFLAYNLVVADTPVWDAFTGAPSNTNAADSGSTPPGAGESEAAGASGIADDPGDSVGSLVYAGTYELTALVEDGRATSADDLQVMRDMGLNSYLRLYDDWGLSLDFSGQVMTGTWEAADDTHLALVIEGSAVSAAIDGETLTLEADGNLMSFTRVSDEAERDDGQGDGAGGQAVAAHGEPDPAMAGTYVLTGLVDGGEAISGDDLNALREAGVPMSLELRRDGTLSFDMSAESIEGTWTASGDGGITLTMSGQTMGASYDGNAITMQEDDYQLVFTRA